MAAANAEDDDEDDYMTMAIPEAAPDKKTETSLQRARRLRLAAAERGRVKTKAQLEADATAARERVLSRSLLDDPAVVRRSKGFAMMAKMGFKKGEALGKMQEEDDALRKEDNELAQDDTRHLAKEDNPQDQQDSSRADSQTESRRYKPRTEPIMVNIKADRGGIGLDLERKKRSLEEAEELGNRLGAEKRLKPDEVDPLAYRDRVARERDLARKERQVVAAQRLAERLDAGEADDGHVPDAHEDNNDNDDDDEDDDGNEIHDDKQQKKKPIPSDTQPLASVNVLWRGMVRARLSAARESRLRHARLQDSTARRPRYNPSFEEEDADDRIALGAGAGLSSDRHHEALAATEIGDEELDQEDEELDRFEALGAEQKLAAVVGWLRREKGYCFWCGCGYERGPGGDAAGWVMDGCPGETEEDH